MVVIAIGGGASGGKTTLAAALAGELGTRKVIHIDDLVPDLETEHGPSFLVSTPDVWLRSPDWLCDQLVRWTARLHPRIVRTVTDLLEEGGGVIEGEGIDPRVARTWDTDDTRVLYVIETDPRVLHQTFAARPSSAHFLALTPPERDRVVEMNRRYNLWLKDLADAHCQPWIPSQPFTTLSERARAALSL